jgi:hypothetical protein
MKLIVVLLQNHQWWWWWNVEHNSGNQSSSVLVCSNIFSWWKFGFLFGDGLTNVNQRPANVELISSSTQHHKHVEHCKNTTESSSRNQLASSSSSFSIGKIVAFGMRLE